MKKFRFIIVLLLTVFVASAIQAQVVKKTDADGRKKKDDNGVVITDRQQAFFEQRQPSDADLQWMKVIYRSLDLTKGKTRHYITPRSPMRTDRVCSLSSCGCWQTTRSRHMNTSMDEKCSPTSSRSMWESCSTDSM